MNKLSSAETVGKVVNFSVTKRWKLVAIAVALSAMSFWFIPPVYLLKGGEVTVTRWLRTKGEVKAHVGPGREGWIFTEKISRNALHAIVVAEDARFYQHFGLDLIEIWKSLKTNLERGRYARGGSTITQQVVKMAFLSREKTLIRKAREAVGAVILEWILPKQKIMEWYINLAEFGDSVYGIREGCWHYFRTKPELLTIEQATHLALVLPSPNKWSIGLRQRSLTPFGHRRFAGILNRMLRGNYITQTQWRNALASGNFGRPIAGYTSLVSEKVPEILCPGDPRCEGEEDIWDVDAEELVFPSPDVTTLVPDDQVKAATPAGKTDDLPYQDGGYDPVDDKTAPEGDGQPIEKAPAPLHKSDEASPP